MKSESIKHELQVYRRLLGYARPYQWRLFLGLLFGMLFGGSTAGLLGSFQKTIAQMFDPTHLPLLAVATIAALLPLFALLRGVGDFLSRYFIEWVGNRVVMDLRAKSFAHIHDLSLQYFTSSRTGELISRATNDTMMVQRAVSNVISDLCREPFVLFGAVGYLFWLDPRLSLVSLILFPICIIPVALFGRKVRRSAREGQEKLADIVSILQETISGVRIVKAFGMEEYEKNRFNERNCAVFGRMMKVAKSQAAIEPIIVFVSFVGLALALLYARWMGMDGAAFFTYAAALVVMYQPVKNLSRIHLHIQQSCAAAERIFEIIDTEIAVKESPNALTCPKTVNDVVFNRVCFSYDEKPILDNVSFTVRSGERLAIVGSSGAGKSTLVSLLPRFFDVTHGQIFINGKDIRSYTLKSLRNLIGIVTQETILFNDTIANNIAYGQMDAPREAIIEAAQRAFAHDFIKEMPEGYETMIGERGVRLSGGQCQRLAIARAMLRNPPILILDEATSALDTESERQVQAALNELMTHRTVFAIAHRLSTVIHADRIIVLDQGRIVEEGTHKELLAIGGLYNHLYELQFNEPGETKQTVAIGVAE